MIGNNLVQDTNRYATTSWSNIDQSDNKRNAQAPHMQQNNASLHNITWDSKMKTSNNYNKGKIPYKDMHRSNIDSYEILTPPDLTSCTCSRIHGLLPVVIKQEMENKGHDLGL